MLFCSLVYRCTGVLLSKQRVLIVGWENKNHFILVIQFPTILTFLVTWIDLSHKYLNMISGLVSVECLEQAFRITGSSFFWWESVSSKLSKKGFNGDFTYTTNLLLSRRSPICFKTPEFLNLIHIKKCRISPWWFMTVRTPSLQTFSNF